MSIKYYDCDNKNLLWSRHRIEEEKTSKLLGWVVASLLVCIFCGAGSIKLFIAGIFSCSIFMIYISSSLHNEYANALKDIDDKINKVNKLKSLEMKVIIRQQRHKYYDMVSKIINPLYVKNDKYCDSHRNCYPDDRGSIFTISFENEEDKIMYTLAFPETIR